MNLNIFNAKTRLSWIWISAAAWILYLLTFSRHYTGGSVEFATEIENGNWAVLLQPQKMFVHPMGWVFYHIWKLAGWRGHSLLPSQVLNSLAGAICVGLIYHIVLSLVNSKKIALIVACGFMVCAGVWMFSTEAEFVTIPLAEALGVLAWLITKSTFTDQHLKPSTILLLALATSASSLTYIANLSIAPAVLAVFWFAEGLARRERLRRMALYLTATVFMFMIVFVPIFAWTHMHEPAGHSSSLQIYGGQGVGKVYGTLDWKNIPWGGYAILRSLAGYPNLGLDDRTVELLNAASLFGRVEFGLYYLITFAIILAPLILMVHDRRTIGQRFRRPASALVVWAGVNAVFAFYWVPRDIQFWMPVLTTWWLLAGLLLAQRDQITLLPGRTRKLNLQWTLVVLAVILFLVNGLGLVIPHRSLASNTGYQVAVGIGQKTQPQDLLFMVMDDNYVPYFSGRQAISLQERLLTLGSKTAALAEIDQRIRQTWDLGGHVYLLSPSLGKTDIWSELKDMGIVPDDLKHFSTISAWTVQTQVVTEVTP